MTNVMIKVMMFFLLVGSSVLALDANQTELVNNMAVQMNMSNETLISFFTYLESYDSTNSSQFILFDNLTQYKQQTDYQIALVNSSVDLEIVNLVSSFKDAARNESVAALKDSINGTFESYDSSVNERISYVKNNYMSRTEMESQWSNFSTQVFQNDKDILSAVEGKFNQLILIMIVLVLAGCGGIFYYFKNMRPLATGQNSKEPLMSVGVRKMSIEEMSNPEYQDKVRETLNLIVKVNKLDLPDPVRKEAMERVNEGVITETNLKDMIEALMVKHDAEKQPYPVQSKHRTERTSSKRRKTSRNARHK